MSAGFKTFEELAKKTEAEALRIPSMGRKSLNEIREFLLARGLAFRQTI